MTIVDPSGQGVNGELYEGAKGRRSFRSLNRHSTSPLSPSISRSPLYVSRTLSRIGSLLSVCVDRSPRSIVNSARFSPFPKAPFSFVPRSLETASILRSVNHHPLMPYSRHHPLFRWLKPRSISLVRLINLAAKKSQARNTFEKLPLTFQLNQQSVRPCAILEAPSLGFRFFTFFFFASLLLKLSLSIKMATRNSPALLSTRTDSELEKASIHDDEKPHSLEGEREGDAGKKTRNYSASEEENLTRALSSRQISMIAIVSFRLFNFAREERKWTKLT